MRAKKIVCFFTVLLLFSGLMRSVGATPDITTVTFRGGGVTIDLKYPDENLPGESIWHNVTITANTALTLRNFTVVIKAPVNSDWQVVFADKLPVNFPLQANISFEWPIQTEMVSEEADGKLSCFMNVSTSQSTDYETYAFYTTHISAPTLSEMRILYNEMLAKYTSLQADYQSLLDEYNGLLINYSSLFANYTALLSEHNQLTNDYNSQVSNYQSLLTQYNKLSDDYDSLNANYRSKINDYTALQSDYNEVNITRYDLQASYTTLNSVYDALNDNYLKLQDDLNSLQKRFNTSEGTVGADRIVMFIFIVTLIALIGFIVYIKRKKQEPYVVIRKETVSMKEEEGS